MDEVVFCEECHRVLSVEFHFCPYCGHKLSGRQDSEGEEVSADATEGGETDAEAPAGPPSFEAIVDESLDRVQESVREYTVRRLDELLVELLRLEAELETIAVTVEQPVEPVGSGSAGQSSPAVSGEETP
jgi:hypothetical protein